MQTLIPAAPPLARGLLLLAVLCGCGDDGTAAPAPSRVVAVQAEESTRTPAELCDILPETAAARPFSMPQLAETVDMDRGWRWINVWATWCAPCVEEIPTLVEWERKLRDEGTPVDLVLLSVDESAEVVDGFRSRVQGVPESARIADPDALPEWLRTLGMEQAPTLPVQILVDPGDRTRCIRSGAVGQDDYAAIRTLVSG